MSDDDYGTINTMSVLPEHLIPDPCEPPAPCTIFEGLLGRSCECEDKKGQPKRVRLYRGRQLTEWLEIKVNDIVGVGDLPSGGNVVRVEPGSLLLYTRVTTADCCAGDFGGGGGSGSGSGGDDGFGTSNVLTTYFTPDPTKPPKTCG